MTLLDRLRAMPPTALLPVGWILGELEGSGGLQTSAPPTGDLSVVALAQHLGWRPSTIRGWLEAGKFPGAYKVGRAWRVPPDAVNAFRTRADDGKASDAGGNGDRPAGGLGDWRNHVRKRSGA